MKRGTLRLLGLASALYVAFLIFVRSLLPENVAPSIPLLAAPLILFVLILSSDLSYHATIPSHEPPRASSQRIPARDVQFLTEQVAVGVTASGSYFDGIVLSRLREVLGDKVSLETGLEKKTVKEMLAKPTEGVRLLGDRELYKLLYSRPPSRGKARLEMLTETIERIEGWKA